jgi:hypothetical protein
MAEATFLVACLLVVLKPRYACLWLLAWVTIAVVTA